MIYSLFSNNAKSGSHHLPLTSFRFNKLISMYLILFNRFYVMHCLCLRWQMLLKQSSQTRRIIIHKIGSINDKTTDQRIRETGNDYLDISAFVQNDFVGRCWQHPMNDFLCDVKFSASNLKPSGIITSIVSIVHNHSLLSLSYQLLEFTISRCSGVLWFCL